MNKLSQILNHFSKLLPKDFFFIPLYALFLISALSCSSQDLRKSETYKINFENSAWSEIEPDQSDYAFLKKKTKSIIMVNSYCKKYDSTSLKLLTSNLLAGINEIKVENRTERKFFDRKTLISQITGKLDGVDLYLTVATLSKNRCIYDFVLISHTAQLRSQDEKSLFEMLKQSQIN